MAGKVAIPIEMSRATNYYVALKNLGADPVVVYPDEGYLGYEYLSDKEFKVEDFDALLLPGGGDILPEYYGEDPHGSMPGNRDIDVLQFALLDAFVRAGKPVFGTCRGHQLINVYFGGTLIQNLPTAYLHARNAPAKDNPDKAHEVTAKGWLATLYGESFVVNSAHHQAVDELGKGLIIDAHCKADGIIEAMHHESLPIWSVQWHPERMCYKNAREDTVDGKLVLHFFCEKFLCQGKK